MKRASGHALQLNGKRSPDKWYARGKNPVELFQIALRDDLWKHFAKHATQNLAVANELVIGVVGQLEDMLRPTQYTNESRRLLKKLTQPVIFNNSQLLRVHRRAKVDGGAFRASGSFHGRGDHEYGRRIFRNPADPVVREAVRWKTAAV